MKHFIHRRKPGADPSRPPTSALVRKIVEWRANRIADPVERLRFLRRNIERFDRHRRISRRAALVALCPILAAGSYAAFLRVSSLLRNPPPPSLERPQGFPDQAPNVWLVERKEEFEVYSNGLRIETKGAVKHAPRRYWKLARASPEDWIHALVVAEPAGIVFHTTESDQVPFDASQNSRLKVLGEGALSHVRRNKSYHYFIDRFGRVSRVVEEAFIANHAGNSAWADDTSVYFGLNSSFLAVAFEAQTRPPGQVDPITAAQVHSGRILTDLLRSKYRIRPSNCVTHSQVSVNPDNMRIGLHTDFALRFPFSRFGLPDNYSLTIPSITIFGFTFDSTFIEMSESRLWKGLLLSQEETRLAAAEKHLTLAQYRNLLQRRYRELAGAIIPAKLTEEGLSQ